jgi:hypothetical protein
MRRYSGEQRHHDAYRGHRGTASDVVPSLARNGEDVFLEFGPEPIDGLPGGIAVGGLRLFELLNTPGQLDKLAVVPHDKLAQIGRRARGKVDAVNERRCTAETRRGLDSANGFESRVTAQILVTREAGQVGAV